MNPRAHRKARSRNAFSTPARLRDSISELAGVLYLDDDSDLLRGKSLKEGHYDDDRL